MAFLKAPASGAPIIAATPWNSNSSPKAFVNFSKPKRSTTTIDLREAKQAERVTNAVSLVGEFAARRFFNANFIVIICGVVNKANTYLINN